MNDIELGKITEDILGEFGFRIVLSVKEHCVNVTAYKVESTGPEGPGFWRKGSSHNGDCVSDHNEAETYLEGYVKWDGCSEFDQDRTHFCGPDDFKKHFNLLKYIYVRAMRLMNSEEEPWDSPAPEPNPDCETPQEVSKLHPDYDSCLLGATLYQQFAYSLRKLVRMTMMQNECDATKAREIVVEEFLKPHAHEVCFINDELLEPISDVEKPVIIVPKQFGKRK